MVYDSTLPKISSSLIFITLSIKVILIDNNQIHDPLRVKFHNVYVFPFKHMYIPNKFPIQAADQPVVRRPVRRAKKPVARKTVQAVAQPAVHTAQQLSVQPTVQSARATRAARRLDRKKM